MKHFQIRFNINLKYNKSKHSTTTPLKGGQVDERKSKKKEVELLTLMKLTKVMKTSHPKSFVIMENISS